MSDVREALDALMVAHDALLEGRDHDAMREAPVWARPDRLLGQDREGSIRDAVLQRMRDTFGGTTNLKPGTVFYRFAEMQARALVDLWNEQEVILFTLQT